MKYKNLWYLGYVLSAIALISAFVFKENRIIEVIVPCLQECTYTPQQVRAFSEGSCRGYIS